MAVIDILRTFTSSRYTTRVSPAFRFLFRFSQDNIVQKMAVIDDLVGRMPYVRKLEQHAVSHRSTGCQVRTFVSSFHVCFLIVVVV
jgi:hypothetical protein